VIFAVVAGCTSEPLAAEFGDGDGYESPDGLVKEIAPPERDDPVQFSGQSEDGLILSSEDYLGSVMVVNFWYAICGPCRAEASDLERLHNEYEQSAVQFLGVNVKDEVASSQAFTRKFSITYPSILDAQTGEVRLAFAGTVAPAATPTTLVLDRKGRVAGRIIGQIDASTLEGLIDGALAE
jgi:peroxiredoxin